MKDRDRLFETVEEVRAHDFPDLDPILVSEILTTQIQMQDDRSAAQRRTQQAVTRWATAQAAQESETTPS